MFASRRNQNIPVRFEYSVESVVTKIISKQKQLLLEKHTSEITYSYTKTENLGRKNSAT